MKLVKIVSIIVIMGMVVWSTPLVLAVTINTTASVDNTPPEANSVVINNGHTIDLTENSTTNVVITATVIDNNGCTGYYAVSVKFFRTGMTSACTTDPNNCYIQSATVVPGTCTDSSDMSANWTATIPVQYYADATDIGQYSGDNWTALVTPSDGTGAGIGATATNEIASMRGLAVTDAIDYGTIELGNNTNDSNQTVTVTNTGNIAIGSQVNSGTVVAMACSRGSIPVGNEKYSAGNANYGSLTELTSSAVTVAGFSVAKRVNAIPSAPTYWGLGMPVTGAIGSCAGTVVFTAI